ncbi:hypothetical protein AB0G54_10780 [Streptomyces yokosukanensis]|uniref:hypothetical protein n=1 Tax=Streptomyces yokosukanensis TaxID=67386 RepID=UPI003449D10C
MNRPARHAAAVVTVSAALLLTACSSGGGGSASDKIKGAGAGAGSPSASATSSTERPKIALPKSFQVAFDGWTNSDPKLQAVMDDGKERLLGTYAAIIAQNPKADYVTFYNEGTALTTGQEWIKGFTDDHLTLIGTGRVFNPQARISPDGSGTLFYCVDEGKGSTKNIKTGEVTNTPANQAYVFYQTKLSRSGDGIWKTTAVASTQGGCK